MNLTRTPTAPPADKVLATYVASAGLIFLCLERINKNFYNITDPSSYVFTEVDLYQTLSQPAILKQLEDATRAQILLRTFEAANQAIATMISKMQYQEPFEASKTATNLIAQLQELTSHSPNNNFNINNFVWESLLPAEAVDAINFLKQQTQPTQPTQPTIIDHTPHD